MMGMLPAIHKKTFTEANSPRIEEVNELNDHENPNIIDELLLTSRYNSNHDIEKVYVPNELTDSFSGT